MVKIKNKIVSVFILLSMLVVYLPTTVMASTYTMTGNNTFEDAYNIGSWNTSNTYQKTFTAYDENVATKDQDSTANWIKFTAKAGDRVGIKITYANLSSTEDLSNFTVSLRNSANKEIESSSQIYKGSTSVRFKYVYYEFPTAGTYYVSMIRNEGLDKVDVGGISFFDPIKTASTTYTFSGTASNTGNPIGNTSGTDSTILTLNLTNDTKIPSDATLMSISTSSSMSPSQGNVRHYLNVNNVDWNNDGSSWNSAKVNSATSGQYYLDIDDQIPARATYKFKYNVLASAKSTMSSVKVTFKYEYNDVYNYTESY